MWNQEPDIQEEPAQEEVWTPPKDELLLQEAFLFCFNFKHFIIT